jgi:hypothetical protein
MAEEELRLLGHPQSAEAVGSKEVDYEATKRYTSDNLNPSPINEGMTPDHAAPSLI